MNQFRRISLEANAAQTLLLNCSGAFVLRERVGISISPDPIAAKNADKSGVRVGLEGGIRPIRRPGVEEVLISLIPEAIGETDWPDDAPSVSGEQTQIRRITTGLILLIERRDQPIAVPCAADVFDNQRRIDGHCGGRSSLPTQYLGEDFFVGKEMPQMLNDRLLRAEAQTGKARAPFWRPGQVDANEFHSLTNRGKGRRGEAHAAATFDVGPAAALTQARFPRFWTRHFFSTSPHRGARFRRAT